MKAEPIKVDIPHLPRHHQSLQAIPLAIRDQWAKAYERAFRSAVESREEFPNSVALSEANKLLAVPEPKNYSDAIALPKWQLMKREERIYAELPDHLKRRVQSAERYLHIVTTDGKEHVFPIDAAA